MIYILMFTLFTISASQIQEQPACLKLQSAFKAVCPSQAERSALVARRGAPGKRGIPGQKGEGGAKGEKGEVGRKGNIGVPSYDRVEEIITHRLHQNNERSVTKCPQTAYLFPRRSTTDYIRVKTPLAPLDEFSLCVWIKVYGTGQFSGVIMSYATPSNFNQFLIIYEPSGNQRLGIHALGETQKLDSPLRKGTDNFICFVIGRSAGFAKVYHNGILSHNVSFTNRKPIPSGGSFIVGQEQDGVLGGFNADQAIHGEVRNYMIWHRILSIEEIHKMHLSKCDCAPGHSISLSPDQIQLEGGVNALYEENECG